jgi:hypothetical protein
MSPAAQSTPERVSTSGEALAKKHDEIIAERASARAASGPAAAAKTDDVI